MSTPYKRIERNWPQVPGGKRALLEMALLGFALLYHIRGSIMGKSRWPRIALVMVSVAYTVFALLFFNHYPAVVYIAGFLLGGVLISIFVIAIFTGGGKK